MRIGDRLAEILAENDVDRVFGLPGGQTLPLYDGIRKMQGKIEHVLLRDERSAGFAADAYARITGKVGLCDATVGPGATNLVSPIAEAYCSSTPILAIISDIPRAWEHRRNRGNASQAIQQLEIFSTISKWQVRVTDPASLDDIVETAFRIATTGKPGPVVISVPDDIALMDFPFSLYRKKPQGAEFPRFRTAADPENVQHACQLLETAKKPLVIVGGGAHISDASQEIRLLVDQLNSAIVTTISGKGIIESHLHAVVP